MKKGITINLISPNIQESIRYEMLSSFILRIGIAFLLMFFVLIILLATSFIYIRSIKSGIEQEINVWETLEKSSENTNIKQDIQYTSMFIQKVSELTKESFQWSQIVEDIVTILPADIRLVTLNGTQIAKQVVITGFAPTRNDVLAAKDALQKLPFVTEVKSPLSNVIPGKDISFQFTLIFK